MNDLAPDDRGLAVLYVLKGYPRLSETFIVNEILGLEREGVRIGVDALLPPEDGPRHEATTAVRAPVRYVPRRPRLRQPQVLGAHAALAARHPRRWWREATRARRQHTWRRFLQAGLVARRVRAERFASVHAHFATAAAEVAGHAAALAAVPFTVTAHAKDIYTDDNASQLDRRLGRAGTVVTVSEHNRAHLTHVLPDVPVRVIRNAVAAPAHASRPTRGPVLCVARLVEKKGIDTLIAATAQLRRRCPDLRLVIIGDGPERPALADQIRRLGLDDVVTVRGALPAEAVAEAYAECALVALPCRVAADGDRDGLPTVLVEALARGLPVVTTDVVGISELVRPDSTGLLVPPDDPDALAEAIVRLWVDPELGRRLGAAGRSLVQRDYDPAVQAAELTDVFASVRAAIPGRAA